MRFCDIHVMIIYAEMLGACCERSVSCDVICLLCATARARTGFRDKERETGTYVDVLN